MASRRLFVIIVVGFSLLSSASCHCQFLVVADVGVYPRGCFRCILHPVVVVAVGVSPLSLVSPCCWRRWSLLLFVVVSFSSSLSTSRCCHWLLLAVVGVLSSLSSLSCNCRHRRLSLCMIPSASAPRRRCHWRRLVIVISVSLSLASPCRWRRVIVVVVVGFSLSSLTESCSC